MSDALKALLQRAGALKQQGRTDEALSVYRRAAASFPQSGLAYHNLAATLGDAGRFEDAAQAARNALAAGLDAPETFLVLARALMNMGDFAGSRAAFEAVLARRPDMTVAHYELSQLIWMFTADRSAALSPFESALRAAPEAPGLIYMRAKALEYIGDPDAALGAMSRLADARPGDLEPQLAASYLCAQTGNAQDAVRYARAAVRVAPDDATASIALASAYLAAGDAELAARHAEDVCARQPQDQYALAILATAWRAMGDERGSALYDYDQYVHAGRIQPPAGWTSLDGYLGDLAAELKAVHPYKTHPFGQSVRHGSQRPDILQAGTPAITAFAEAADPVIKGFMDKLGRGDDPVRSRNTGRWRRLGIWSVWLRPGGFHTDHVHPAGWLSSAFYVEVPPCVRDGGHEGWIQFGQPGVPVAPVLTAGRAVQPEPGLLVLFPSYMWHGTVPFSGEAPRLSMAMDILPV